MEWVKVKNTGRLPVNIKGWTLADKSGHSYRFDSLHLNGHSQIRVHTGTGHDNRRTSTRTAAPTSGTTPPSCATTSAASSTPTSRSLTGPEPTGELCRPPATTVRRRPVPAAHRHVWAQT
ncbi:lamin tail domain-containing protein [Streptomyces sp. 2314.4]|uniref:lamin tail domain-containing protein n=1 Tax=unclassified Streptomyces TaxID=2593676 RepID=UPI0026937503